MFCACLLSRVWLCVTSWAVAHQAPLPVQVLQARILEWVAMSSFRGSSWPRDRTQVSRVAGGFFTIWATREAQEYPIPSPGDLPNPEIKPGSPALQADSLPCLSLKSLNLINIYLYPITIKLYFSLNLCYNQRKDPSCNKERFLNSSPNGWHIICRLECLLQENTFTRTLSYKIVFTWALLITFAIY